MFKPVTNTAVNNTEGFVEPNYVLLLTFQNRPVLFKVIAEIGGMVCGYNLTPIDEVGYQYSEYGEVDLDEVKPYVRFDEQTSKQILEVTECLSRVI